VKTTIRRHGLGGRILPSMLDDAMFDIEDGFDCQLTLDHHTMAHITMKYQNLKK
jgi:hypothetical protein